jgi:hypothetical protein
MIASINVLFRGFCNKSSKSIPRNVLSWDNIIAMQLWQYHCLSHSNWVLNICPSAINKHCTLREHFNITHGPTTATGQSIAINCDQSFSRPLDWPMVSYMNLESPIFRCWLTPKFDIQAILLLPLKRVLKGISNDNSTLACIQYFERGTAFTQGKNQFGPVHVHLIQCL